MNRTERKDGVFAGQIGSVAEIDSKALSEDGTFEGYGSVFGEIDRGGDVMVPGAFTKSLAKRPVERVKMLWQHRTDKIIGKWLEMREDAKGLYVKGKLFLNVQGGREAYEMMKEGALDGLSIGYRTITDEYDRDSGVRRLMEVELLEVSTVTFPMNEAATISLVKGDKLPTEREFERFLMRDAGFTASQAKAIIASGYKSLTAERDAGEGDDEALAAIQRLTAALRG